MRITAQARTLVKEHNSHKVTSGFIYLIELSTGKIAEFVTTYAAEQVKEGNLLYGTYAVLRIAHTKMSLEDAQQFLDKKGIGW